MIPISHQHSSKIHPKSTKMVPRNAPKVILEASRFPGPQKVSAPDVFFEAFGDTCAILGAIWCPAGRQVDPKIERFDLVAPVTIYKKTLF